MESDVEAVKRDWRRLMERLADEFGDLDLQGVLFLVGVQELGQGPRVFSKDEKQDLMHIATCRLMSVFGFYEKTGVDDDGWPLWRLCSRPPAMKLKEQDLLLKRAAILYFRELGFT